MSVTSITSNDEDPRKKITLDAGTYSYRVAPLPENGEAPVWSDWSTSFDVIEPATVGGIQWKLPAPTAETDPSNAGDVAYDSKFFYIAIATDTWKRIPLTTITQDPEIFVSGPTDQVSVDGQAQFTVQATIVNSQETIEYQWQRSIDNGTTWSSLVGETQPTLNISGATLQQNGYKYRVIASATGVPATTSGGAELILTVSSHLLAESGDALITENGDYISTDSTTVIDVGWQNRGNSLTGYPSTQGLYGWSTAVSEDGTIFAASEPRLNKVHVYKYTRGAWTAFGNQDDLVFDNPNVSTDKSLYGSKIALSRDGRVLAITRGQLLESDNRVGIEVTLNAQSSGASDVTVMELRNGRWVQRGQTITSSDVQYRRRVVVTQELAEEQTKIISDGTGGNTYGTGLSLNSRGDVIAIGCPNNDYGSVGTTNGYVEVLFFDGIEWQRLPFESQGIPGGFFGGERIFQTGSTASDSSNATSTHWNLMETLGDEFGTSVELNEEGDILIVGAPGYKVDGWQAAQQNDGAAFVFSYKKRVDTGAASAQVDRAILCWQWDGDLPQIHAGQYRAEGRLGFDVGMSDSGLSIFAGEPSRSVYEAGSSTSSGGIVARAEQTSAGTTGTFFNHGQLGFSSVTPGDYFGKQISVSADGLTVAVAIPGSDEGGVNDRGRVKVFRKESGTWSQLQNDIIGPNANSGKGLHGAFTSAPGRYHISVSLSKDGETLVVGFPFNEEATGGQQAQFGKVDVYHVGQAEVTLADDAWYSLSVAEDQAGDIEAATAEALAPTAQVLYTDSIYRTAVVLAAGGQLWERHVGTWDQPLSSVTWQSACLASNGLNPNDPTSSARLQHPVLLAVSSDGFIYKRDYLTNSSLSLLSGYTNEWKAIRASYRIGYAVAQKTDGSLWEISLTSTSTDNSILGTKTDWTEMDGAEGVFAAIDSSGDIYTFGHPNEFGEMGFQGNYDPSTASWGISSPAFVKLDFKNARSVVCSQNNMMVIDQENRLRVYGYEQNEIDELGNTGSDGFNEPKNIKWWKVFATTSQVTNSSGRGWAEKFYGITTQGQVYGWGDVIGGVPEIRKLFRDSLVDAVIGISPDQDVALSDTNRGEVLIHTVPSINAVDFSDEKTEGFSLTGRTVPSSDTITFYEPTDTHAIGTVGPSSDIYTQVQAELTNWPSHQPWEIAEAKLVNNNTIAAFSLERSSTPIERRLVVFEKGGSTWNKVGSSWVNGGSGINTNSNYSPNSYGAWDISEDGNVIVLQGVSNGTNYTTKFYSKQANGYQEEVSVAGAGIVIGPLKLSADGSKLLAEGGLNAPVVYSVDFVEQTWSQIGAHITSSNTDKADSVALSSTGQVLAIGGDDIVRVYTSGGTSWSQVGSDITSGYSNAQLFGESIDLDDSGDLIAIGDSAWDSGDGQVRVYENNSGTWSQKGTALSSVSGSNDNLGKEVALDSTGSYLMVTAPNAVHPTISSWVKEETLVGDVVGGTVSGRYTYMGLSGIDFSDSGTRVVIPSYGYDTMAYGTTPKNEGKVEVYEKSGSSWSKIGQSIEGDVSGGGSNQQLGSYPYISGDGSRIVFNENYGNLFYSSQYHAQSVTVYEYSAGTWTRVGTPIEVQRTFASGNYSGQPVGCRFRAHGISTDGTRIVVVEQEENDTALDPVIRVYEESGGSWSQLGPDITGSTGFYRQNGSDEIYADISGDGTTVIAGQHNGQEIKVFKYNSTANTWTNIWTKDLSTQASYTAYDKVTDRRDYFRPVQINGDGTKLAYSTERMDALNVQTGWSGYVLQPTIRYIEIDSLGQESVNRTISPYTSGWHEYSHPTYNTVPSNTGAPASYELDFKLGENAEGEAVILLKRANVDDYGNDRFVEYDRYTYQPQNSSTAPASAGTGEGRNWKKEHIYRDQYVHNSSTASTTGYMDVYQYSQLSGSKSLSTIAFGSSLARNYLGQLDIVHSTPQRSGYGRLFKYYNPTGSGDDWNSVSIITPDHSTSVTSSCDVVNEGSTTTNSWTQVGSDIDGEAYGDESGFSVSFSDDGTIVAIGARSADSNLGNEGHVRVYSWNGSAWNQMGSDIDGEAQYDLSGSSVSLSSDGQTVAIGATKNDGNGTGLHAGHVRVYSWNGSAWTQLGSDIDGEAYGDESGYSVSLSSDGETVAIGARWNDGNGSNSGHVRVYSWSGSAWTQLGSDIDGEATGDSLGFSVSLSSDGETVAIGGPYNDGTGTDVGHVRVYSWSGSAWNQVGADIDGEAGGFGWSVSLSSDGETVAIGAPYNDGTGTDVGHVRVYSWNGSAWNQMGADIDGEAAEDLSGSSVSLSGDGTTVAIGAPSNDGTGSGAGHVRVYSWDGSAWNQAGADIDGEAATDQSGNAVSISYDGSKVAIGAKGNDDYLFNAGHVRVYSYSTTTTEEVYYAVGSPNNNQVSVRKYDGSTTTELGDILTPGAGLTSQSWYNASTLGYGTTVKIRSATDLKTPASGDSLYMFIGMPGYDNGKGAIAVSKYNTFQNRWDGFATAVFSDGTNGDMIGTAVGENIGREIDVSSDGKRIVTNVDTLDNTARSRVYEYNSSQQVWQVVNETISIDTSGLSSSTPTVGGVAIDSDGDFTALGYLTLASGAAVSAFGTVTSSSSATLLQTLGTTGLSAAMSEDGTRVVTHNGEVYDVLNGTYTLATTIPFDLSDYGIGAGGSTWTQLGADIDGEAPLDSAYIVSLSSDGQTVAIGAPYNDGNGTDSGHVRIYSWTGSAWSQLGADIDAEASVDRSGFSVSLSSDGETVAIGAPYNEGVNGQTLNSGHVRIYSWSGSAWNQVGADIDGEVAGDISGRSVSLSGDGETVAIGANYNDDNGVQSGHVRVYSWNGSAWTQLGADIDGEAANDYSGTSVSLSSDGGIVAIGAPYNNGYTGHVRVYSWNGSAWTQLGADIEGEAAFDYSGNFVSLSSDGGTVAIGAPNNDGNGADSGHVRVYSWNGSAWTQLGADIDGEAAYDYSGNSVSLSSDGQTVAIGSPNNDGNGSNSGHVRVFSLVDGSVTTDDVINDVIISGDGRTVVAEYSSAGSGSTTVDQYNRLRRTWRFYREESGTWSLIDTLVATSDDFFNARLFQNIDGISYDGNYIVMSDTAIASYSPQFFMFEYDGTSYKQIGGRSHSPNFIQNILGKQNTSYNTAERSYPRSLGRDGKTLIVSTRYIGSQSKVVYPGTGNLYYEYFDKSRRKDAAALIEFKTTINITTQPQDFTPTGASTETLTVAATTSTGALISYQWQESTTSGASWSDIIGEQSASLSIPLANLLNGKQYRAKLNAKGSPEVISSTATVQAATIAITEGAIDGVVSPDVRVYQTVAGVPPAVTIPITATSSAPISYQWQVQDYTGTYSDIAGANSSSLTLSNLDDSYDGYLYRCKVTSGITEAFSEEKNLEVYPIIKEDINPALAESIDIVALRNEIYRANYLQAFAIYSEYGKNYYYLSSSGQERNTVTGVTAGWSVNYPPGPTYEFDLRKDGVTIQQSSDVAQDSIGVKGVGTYFRRIVSARDNGLSLGSAALTGVSSPLLEFNSLRRDFTNQQWDAPNGHRWHPSYGQTIQREVAAIPLEYGKYDFTQKIAYEQDANGVYDTSTNFYDFTSSECYYSAPFVNFYGPHHAGGTSPTFSAFMTHNLPVNSSNSIYSTQLSLQWQVSFDNGANWSNLSGATTDTLSLSGLTSSDNLNQYRLVATYAYGTESLTFTSGAAIFYHNATPVTMLNQGYAIEKDDTNGGVDPSGSPVIITASSNQVITLGNQQLTVSRVTLPHVTDLAWNHLTSDAYTGKKLYYTHLSGDHADTFTGVSANEAAGIDIVWETPEDGGTNSEYARYAESDTAVGSTTNHGVFTGNSPFGTGFYRSKRFILPNGAWVLTRPIITQTNGPSTVGDWTWIYRENH